MHRSDIYMSTSRLQKPSISIKPQAKRKGISSLTGEAISGRAQVELWTEALVEELAVWVARIGSFQIWAVKCYQLAVSVLQIKALKWTQSAIRSRIVVRNLWKVLSSCHRCSFQCNRIQAQPTRKVPTNEFQLKIYFFYINSFQK